LGVLVGPHVVIEADVRVGECTRIGAGCVIKRGCEIGRWNTLLPHCVIGTDDDGSHVRVGDWNRIGPHAALGDYAQSGDSEYKPVGGLVTIGDGNEMRDYVSIHAPGSGPDSAGPEGSPRSTTIGNGCTLMTRAHVAHDCTVGDGCVMYAYALMAGFATLCRGGRLGMNAILHQRSTVGERAMVGMGTMVTKDVPPFVICVTGVCTRLNTHLLEHSAAELREYAAWLRGAYTAAAESRGGRAPDVRSASTPGWARARWAGGAPPWFAEPLADFLAPRHGGRGLTPLAQRSGMSRSRLAASEQRSSL
jgi:UDP-N-acetylglucosamine acyltransferase